MGPTPTAEFFGKWSVVGKLVTAESPGFTITGSDASDGFYSTAETLPGVTGSSWSISTGQGNENPNLFFSLSRTDEYTVASGLASTLTISSSMALPSAGSATIVLTCTNLDPDLNPLPIQGTAISFTITKTTVGEPAGDGR